MQLHSEGRHRNNSHSPGRSINMVNCLRSDRLLQHELSRLLGRTELYLQGRRAENQGFGIGAFAYYRRVGENQKGRIIREMGKVAKKLGASEEVLARFESAASETQFSTAIERVKHGIPTTLLIGTHNPLSLLHTALSDGLHEQHDEVCLELAASIRLVLTELAERMSQVLKDETELSAAVNKLLNRKATAKGQLEPNKDR
jgi:hypothetical protein